VVTAVLLPDAHDADALRELILRRFDMSLGAGLGRLKGRVFRIGHVGDLNDLSLAGALCGVELGLRLAGVPLDGSGVQAALDRLAEPLPEPSDRNVVNGNADRLDQPLG
jgi:alanine-glyoxylate transaminase/serine-glyoxylate transaminase/serine-pyruvate transaminase